MRPIIGHIPFLLFQNLFQFLVQGFQRDFRKGIFHRKLSVIKVGSQQGMDIAAHRAQRRAVFMDFKEAPQG